MVRLKDEMYWTVIFCFLSLTLIFPELCLAETLDGGGEFDALLLEILDLLNDSILTAALVFAVVGFGISMALFPQNRETIERGARVVIGLIIAAKGSGFVADALGLSFLI